MFKFLCLLVMVIASIENANAVLENYMGADSSTQHTKKSKIEQSNVYNTTYEPTQNHYPTFLSPCSSPTPFNSTATTPQMSPHPFCYINPNWPSESETTTHLLVWSDQIKFGK